MTTPTGLVDADNASMSWQNNLKKRQDIQQRQQTADVISTPAGNLPDTDYWNRIQTIRNDSATATSGSIASDNVRKQYEAAVTAQNQARVAQQAQYDAYQEMLRISGGAGFGQPGWETIPGQSGGGSAGWDGKYDGSDQAIANLMRAAGFPEDAIGVGLGVVQAESSGRLNATHPNTSGRYAGTIDQGLWQINDMHKGMYAGKDIFDPLVNTQIAYELWKAAGNSWSPWTTFNAGLANAHTVPPIQPYVANTGGSTGLRNAQVGGAQTFTGVPTSSSRAQALAISKQVLNIPYVWGGDSLKTGVDCSGLVQQVYAQMGISMPRQARAQATTGVRVGSYNDLQPGDLVAFKWAGGYAGPNVVSHIAIYMGNGQIIEAAGGSHGDIRNLGNSAQDKGAIYIHTRFPGE